METNLLTNVLQIALLVGIAVIFYIQRNQIKGLKDYLTLFDPGKLKEYNLIIEEMAQRKVELMEAKIKSKEADLMSIAMSQTKQLKDFHKAFIMLLLDHSQADRKSVLETYIQNGGNRKMLLESLDNMKKFEDNDF